MTTLTQARKDAAEMIQSALDRRLEQAKCTEAYRRLVADLEAFAERGNDDTLRIGEGGELVTSISLILPQELCTAEDGTGDNELAELVLESAGADLCLYFHQDSYSRGYDEWTAEQSLGEPVVFNESPERNCYAIHSDELGLKLDRKAFTDEDHGFLLIEQAMRKAGCFPSVVHTDRYGFAFYLTVPAWIANLSDSKLEQALEAKALEDQC